MGTLMKGSALPGTWVVGSRPSHFSAAISSTSRGLDQRPAARGNDLGLGLALGADLVGLGVGRQLHRLGPASASATWRWASTLTCSSSWRARLTSASALAVASTACS